VETQARFFALYYEGETPPTEVRLHRIEDGKVQLAVIDKLGTPPVDELRSHFRGQGMLQHENAGTGDFPVDR